MRETPAGPNVGGPKGCLTASTSSPRLRPSALIPQTVPHPLRHEKPEAQGAEELDRVREAEHALEREQGVPRQLPRDDEERRERAEPGGRPRRPRQQEVDRE